MWPTQAWWQVQVDNVARKTDIRHKAILSSLQSNKTWNSHAYTNCSTHEITDIQEKLNFKKITEFMLYF